MHSVVHICCAACPLLQAAAQFQQFQVLFCRLWELVDADTWTLDFMEKHPETFPWAHFPAALPRVCGAVRRVLPESAVRELLLSADASGSGAVPFRRFHVRTLEAFVRANEHAGSALTSTTVVPLM